MPYLLASCFKGWCQAAPRRQQSEGSSAIRWRATRFRLVLLGVVLDDQNSRSYFGSDLFKILIRKHFFGNALKKVARLIRALEEKRPQAMAAKKAAARELVEWQKKQQKLERGTVLPGRRATDQAHHCFRGCLWRFGSLRRAVNGCKKLRNNQPKNIQKQ